MLLTVSTLRSVARVVARQQPAWKPQCVTGCREAVARVVRLCRLKAAAEAYDRGRGACLLDNVRAAVGEHMQVCATVSVAGLRVEGDEDRWLKSAECNRPLVLQLFKPPKERVLFNRRRSPTMNDNLYSRTHEHEWSRQPHCGTQQE